VATEQIAGGVLTFTSRAADLSGVVTAPGGSPVPSSVVLFPSERTHWVPQSRRIHVVQTAHDGRYAIRHLLPGEYLLATVDGLEPGEQFDPEFLQRVAPDARRVTLDAGIPAVANLHVR
jgi:hypothetical protein